MKEKIVKIGNVNFKFKRFPVLEANKRLARLMKIISPIAGSLLAKVGANLFSDEENTKKQTTPNGIDFFDEYDKLARLDDRMLEEISRIVLDSDFIEVQLRDGSYIHYGEDVLDDVFDEDPSLYLVLIMEAIKFNFNCFFTRLMSVFSEETEGITKIKNMIQK